GALLQNRLVSSITSEANVRSAALPPSVRSRFVSQVHNSASNGIQVGAGQTGGTTHQAAGTAPGIAAEIARIAHDVFTFAYVTAMRQTMVLPIILLGIGALSCLALKGGKPAQPPVPEEAEKAAPPRGAGALPPSWARLRRIGSRPGTALAAEHSRRPAEPVWSE